jgi:hypothetical protein
MSDNEKQCVDRLLLIFSLLTAGAVDESCDMLFKKGGFLTKDNNKTRRKESKEKESLA